MEHWIFQANPDRFNINKYIEDNTNIVWTVREKHFLKVIQPGDEIFMWRAAGKSKGVSGIVASGIITDIPREMPQDEASNRLWAEGTDSSIDWRVPITLHEKCLSPKTVIKREWLQDDPILSGVRILKMKNETNYRIGPNEAARLSMLVRNTGRDWNEAESIAGLWAYARTLGKPVSRLQGSPVAEVALTIGRAVTGVYNKVMNFRAIDTTDPRSGLKAGGKVDKEVWEQFFDRDQAQIRLDRLMLNTAGCGAGRRYQMPNLQPIPISVTLQTMTLKNSNSLQPVLGEDSQDSGKTCSEPMGVYVPSQDTVPKRCWRRFI